jgi:hypothetical protein
MSDRRYEWRPFIVNWKKVQRNRKRIARALEAVYLFLEKSIWLPLGVEAHRVFTCGYIGKTDEFEIQWNEGFPPWSPETASERELW